MWLCGSTGRALARTHNSLAWKNNTVALKVLQWTGAARCQAVSKNRCVIMSKYDILFLLSVLWFAALCVGIGGRSSAFDKEFTAASAMSKHDILFLASVGSSIVVSALLLAAAFIWLT